MKHLVIVLLLGFANFHSFYAFGQENCDNHLVNLFYPRPMNSLFKPEAWRNMDPISGSLELSDHIFAWGSYLDCLKKSGEATKSEIKDTENYLQILYTKNTNLSNIELPEVKYPELEAIHLEEKNVEIIYQKRRTCDPLELSGNNKFWFLLCESPPLY